MKEIKFRAWTGEKMEYDIVVGKFGVFYVNPGIKGDGLDEKDRASLTPFNTIYPKETPVMQFTDLKDKNGKEIYEGDIVKSYVGQGEVCFGSYMAGGQDYYASYAYGFYIKRSKDEDDTETLNHCEIIGNIYENPELLK